ncbi:uncharacterized protein LOC121420026 [Lytechinus variegatus]|uniref:uncharacterized protein LOC121420026 n=1 Tax=Lytechinus variegatus TaxID=7654 RepID=UPI001BB167B5|nr:uncharacterized protein LOC121420026 [Lytechinus variegatus]
MSNKVSIISYNCQCANDSKLPFLRELFDECDFMLIQEHGLYKSQFGWFDNINEVNGVGKHGMSAMNEEKQSAGRPYGGTAIIWKHGLNVKVEPKITESDSKRLSAVIVTLENQKRLLLGSIYMPCDDRCQNANLVEFQQVLNEIDILMNELNPDFACFGGDFNTDVSRDTFQTRCFLNFFADYHICTQDELCDFDFTFSSKGSNHKSLIDHFVLTDSLVEALQVYECIDTVNNFSDHVAVKCQLDLYMSEFSDISEHEEQTKKCYNWSIANQEELDRYVDMLSEILHLLVIPYCALNCREKHCQRHSRELNEFHDKIVDACLNAAFHVMCKSSQKPKCKVIPGWNEHVEVYFKNALLATAIASGSTRSFWSEVKKYNRSKNVSRYPNVDGVQGKDSIAGMFADKFDGLYNSVSSVNWIW